MKSSFMLTTIRKQAFEQVTTNSDLIRTLIATEYNIQNKVKSLQKLYNYIPSQHRCNNNRNNAGKSKGCGCRECLTRYNYVQAKWRIRHFKNWYFTDTLYYIFENCYVKEQLSNETENQYYLRKMKELEEESKSLHNIYKATVDTLQHTLTL